MGVIRSISDGLVNVVANLGTGRDKAAHTQYLDITHSPHELLSMYRNSWLAAAIVDYPAEDATRKWRAWRADKDQITAIERLEKRLGVQRAVQDCLTAARLYGGAAIFINTADQDQAQPVRPGTEIQSLVVLTPNSLQPGEEVRDIFSPWYGRAEFFTLTSGSVQVQIHASRLVVMQGAPLPQDSRLAARTTWGDSVLQRTMDAVKQIDSTMANIASLVFEAKVDVLKFEGFADLMAANQDDLATRRLQYQAAMKGINGALVIDAKDDYEQKSASFASLPEVVGKFMDAVSGSARIPVTRLYGRAAVGLSGSGDGDERVYFDRIGHVQSTEIEPAMYTLDELLVEQALGSRPPEIYYEWRPLRQITESERADIFGKTAAAARAIAGNNAGAVIPMDALSDALVNELTELGVLPGLDHAVEEYGSLAEQTGFVGGEE